MAPSSPASTPALPAVRSLSRFERLRNLGVVAILALGFALTLAIFAEANYARPYCVAYGQSKQLTYGGLEYPSAPPGVPGRRAAGCLFAEADRTLVRVALADVAPSHAMVTLVEVATSPLLTTPFLIALFAFVLSQLYGALGIEARR